MMESPLTPLVWYPAQVLRVIDGDTVRCSINLGGGVTYPSNVRVYGVNAPERRRLTHAAGDRAFLFLRDLVGSGGVQVRGQGSHLDRYGRVVADIRVQLAAGDGGTPAPVDVGGQLLGAGVAVPWRPAA